MKTGKMKSGGTTNAAQKLQGGFHLGVRRLVGKFLGGILQFQERTKRDMTFTGSREKPATNAGRREGCQKCVAEDFGGMRHRLPTPGVLRQQSFHLGRHLAGVLLLSLGTHLRTVAAQQMNSGRVLVSNFSTLELKREWARKREWHNINELWHACRPLDSHTSLSHCMMSHEMTVGTCANARGHMM